MIPGLFFNTQDRRTGTLLIQIVRASVIDNSTWSEVLAGHNTLTHIISFLDELSPGIFSGPTISTN
jgi:hypothetical protein